MSISDKNLREKEFHNKLQSKKKGRFENIFYKAISNAWDDFYEYLKSQSKDTEILDYGCGTGLTIKKVVEFNPRKITGIDISEVSHIIISPGPGGPSDSGISVLLLNSFLIKFLF